MKKPASSIYFCKYAFFWRTNETFKYCWSVPLNVNDTQDEMRDGGRADDNAGVGRQPPGQLQPCTEQDKLPSQGNRFPAKGCYMVSY